MLQYKCDLCYDRSSHGLLPMCASVCPTDALFYGTFDELQAKRPSAKAVDVFDFGNQSVVTGNALVAPAGGEDVIPGGYSVWNEFLETPA